MKEWCEKKDLQYAVVGSANDTGGLDFGIGQQLAGRYLLAALMFLSLPLLLKQDFHALRHTNYAGFFSLVILVVAIVNRAYQVNVVERGGSSPSPQMNWYSSDFSDIVYAFPLISLSFLSIYNVLSVHSNLINPTRERIKFVFDVSIGVCLV